MSVGAHFALKEAMVFYPIRRDWVKFHLAWELGPFPECQRSSSNLAVTTSASLIIPRGEVSTNIFLYSIVFLWFISRLYSPCFKIYQIYKKVDRYMHICNASGYQNLNLYGCCAGEASFTLILLVVTIWYYYVIH